MSYSEQFVSEQDRRQAWLDQVFKDFLAEWKSDLPRILTQEEETEVPSEGS